MVDIEPGLHMLGKYTELHSQPLEMNFKWDNYEEKSFKAKKFKVEFWCYYFEEEKKLKKKYI